MKLHYYPETDSLYIDLNSKPSADSREIAEGLVVDFESEGDVVGIDIEHASRKLDLKTLETVDLPASTTKITWVDGRFDHQLMKLLVMFLDGAHACSRALQSAPQWGDGGFCFR